MSLLVRKMIIWTSVLLLHVLLSASPVSSFELNTSSQSFHPKRVESQPLHRFKSLERVFNRLDGISSTVLPKSEELLTSNSGDLTHRARYPQELTSDLEDDLEEDDEDSYEDENDTDLLGDKSPSPWSYSSSYRQQQLQNQNQQRMRATTTTTTTTTTTSAPPSPMSYSQYKWEQFGTRQRIDNYRQKQTEAAAPGPLQRHHNHHNNNRNHHQAPANLRHPSSSNNQSNNNQTRQSRSQTQSPDTSIREAINHALKVSREGSCKEAKPRLVRVQDFYPFPGKTYVPHCTILHQCSDDSGCCRHDVLTCAPKSTQRVELAFYTITTDSNRGSTVERLVFYNHTECECKDRLATEIMPRDVPIPAASSSLVTNPDGQVNNRARSISNYEPAGMIRSQHSQIQCKCPSAYTERVLADGSCTCDCFDKQKECLRLKRGRIFFTMQDKWCIQSGRCEVPDCAYGSYINLVGRCPRKVERYGTSMSWHRYNT